MRSQVESRRFEGIAASIPEVRAFAAGLLDGSPRCDDAILVLCEVATNAVRHTDSGLPGGSFTVTVASGDVVRVEVHDSGSTTFPRLKPWSHESCGGRGVAIMDLLADTWGYDLQGGDGAMVWFEYRVDASAVAA